MIRLVARSSRVERNFYHASRPCNVKSRISRRKPFDWAFLTKTFPSFECLTEYVLFLREGLSVECRSSFRISVHVAAVRKHVFPPCHLTRFFCRTVGAERKQISQRPSIFNAPPICAHHGPLSKSKFPRQLGLSKRFKLMRYTCQGITQACFRNKNSAQYSQPCNYATLQGCCVYCPFVCSISSCKRLLKCSPLIDAARSFFLSLLFKGDDYTHQSFLILPRSNPSLRSALCGSICVVLLSLVAQMRTRIFGQTSYPK